jgi:hypothetical protein
MGQSRTTVDRIFSKQHGIPAIYSALSRDRFKFILKNLNFDDSLDPQSRVQRTRKDRMAAMRDIFEAINQRWALGLVPSDYMTIDETLYSSRNRVSFAYAILFKLFSGQLFASSSQNYFFCDWNSMN